MSERYQMLLYAFLPFVCWGLGLVGIVMYWRDPVFLVCSVLLIVTGFKNPIVNPKVVALYTHRFQDELRKVEKEDWICVDFEPLGSEKRFALVPADFGVAIRQGGLIVFRSVSGLNASIDPQVCRLVDTSPFSMACSVKLIDLNSNEVVFRYSITPQYKGDDLSIATKAHLRAAWFAKWIGCELE